MPLADTGLELKAAIIRVGLTLGEVAEAIGINGPLMSHVVQGRLCLTKPQVEAVRQMISQRSIKDEGGRRQ